MVSRGRICLKNRRNIRWPEGGAGHWNFYKPPTKKCLRRPSFFQGAQEGHGVEALRGAGIDREFFREIPRHFGPGADMGDDELGLAIGGDDELLS